MTARRTLSIRKIDQRLRNWWQGEFIGEKYEGFFLIGFEKHWTARAAGRAWQFWKEEWKWIVGTLLAITALFVAL